MNNLLFFGFFAGLLPVNFDSHAQTAGTMEIHRAGKKTDKLPGGREINFPATADAATIIKRSTIPIICYHEIRNWKRSDPHLQKRYIVPINHFRAQIKSLADSGYHTILPDQLYDYLNKGTPLPPKPIMITFDDSYIGQYRIARPELKKYGFKGVYFITTDQLDGPDYMSDEEVKKLADEGNTIGNHTFDHRNVTEFSSQRDWKKQVEKPSLELEDKSGKHTDYFAYPFGKWNRVAIAGLKRRGFKAAFQYADFPQDPKPDPDDPLFSIRRIGVSGSWSGPYLQEVIKKYFQNKD